MKRLILMMSIIMFSKHMTLAQCTAPCYLYKPYENDATQISKLTAEKKWEIENVNMSQQALIADVLHDDGIPEIIISGPRGTSVPSPVFTNELYIINTQTQSVEKKIKTALMYCFSVGNYTVADIDNDCKQEIIIFATDRVRDDFSNPDSIRGRLMCYDMDGGLSGFLMKGCRKRI